MSENEIIISKTDTRGKITYGNRAFIHYSGFAESELLGQPHNIIRHPDMPKAIFRLMWHTLQAEQEFFGYVKNLRKDGGYYWTYANITPSYSENNNVIGYFSVRRKPHARRLELFSGLYREMIKVENQYNNSQEAMDRSIQLLNEVLQYRDKNYDEFLVAI